MFRTLIVEDNRAFRQSLKGILFARFPFMDIGEATDAKEALQKVDALRPDLIFVDIKLPENNGLELTKRIRVDHPKTTIIILTSYDLPEYRQAANQCGANYFLSKDISTEELVKLVQLILTEKGIDSHDPDED